MAVMALADNDTPIICNGFKDDEYIEMAMLAQKMGRRSSRWWRSTPSCT
jgi:arginine decarboxylase